MRAEEVNLMFEEIETAEEMGALKDFCVGFVKGFLSATIVLG